MFAAGLLGCALFINRRRRASRQSGSADSSLSVGHLGVLQNGPARGRSRFTSHPLP
jgi:hypothetical protein